MAISRRIFCYEAATLLLAPRILLSQTTATSRPDVAAIDHDRILDAAKRYVSQSPTPLTALPCPRSPGSAHDYYSEAEDYWPDPSAPGGPYVERPGSH
ncbi:MAG: hypothetical protein WDN23_00260 [Edaphobacter sp.]